MKTSHATFDAGEKMMITEKLIRDIIKYVEAGLLKLLKIPKAAFTDNKYIFLVGLLALLSVTTNATAAESTNLNTAQDLSVASTILGNWDTPNTGPGSSLVNAADYLSIQRCKSTMEAVKQGEVLCMYYIWEKRIPGADSAHRFSNANTKKKSLVGEVVKKTTDKKHPTVGLFLGYFISDGGLKPATMQLQGNTLKVYKLEDTSHTPQGAYQSWTRRTR